MRKVSASLPDALLGSCIGHHCTGLLCQRVLGVAVGYFDCNNPHRLPCGPALNMLLGCFERFS